MAPHGRVMYDLSGGGAVTFTECTHIIDKPIHVDIGKNEHGGMLLFNGGYEVELMCT